MKSVKDSAVKIQSYALCKFVWPAVLILALLGSLMLPVGLSAQDIKLPKQMDPPRLVSDYAGMLSSGEANLLEQKLTTYDDTSSTQIAIVIISGLEGADIAQYATELGIKWGIGRKGKDNGVLLLIASKEHKMFIATGRGVEASLPDIICKRIIDHALKPRFKEGNYYAGINAAIDEITARLAGQFSNDDTSAQPGPNLNSRWIALVIVLVVLLLFLFGGGGGGRTYGSSGGSSALWFLTGLLGGRLLGGGGGGSWGGDRGGGFGGFGGGDFGGGGAGGDW